MRKNPVPRFLFGALLLCLFGLLSAGAALADNVYGSIRGTVTDPSGAVVAGVKVTATNTATGLATTVTSNAAGDFAFVQLSAPGTYDVKAEIAGFQNYQARNIQLELNQIYVLNLQLSVGTTTQEVTVEANAAQVETTSIELGTTVEAKQIVDLPLNGRNWVQLQQLEPGVVAASDGRGSFATNGSQAAQNSYLINGTDNNDFPLNTNLTTPSPDAIGEFKMVTNTINPEYGRNSGAIVNAIIKGGTNGFHGDGFEFYRDTSLNSRNFFQPKPQIFHQNQFGGTIGGPIRKDHTFFFFSYQGTRNRVPELANGGGNTPVFSAAQRDGTGGFADVEKSAKLSPFPLVGDNGQTFGAGTPYSTIFSQGFIPTADFNTVSVGLLKFVPPPNVGNNFQFNPIITGLDDQYLGRIDENISAKDSIWGYALLERNPTVTALPFTGATLPGFAEVDQRHFQQYTLAWNHTFSGTTLNEARFGYTRFNFLDVAPQSPVSPASAGFTGIIPQQQGADQSLPVVTVTGLFTLGFSGNGPQPRIDQTYQATDNLTKIAGTHTLKFGFDMRRFQVFNPFLHNNDGNFSFAGAGAFSTGDAGADFLLGIPDSYAQGSGDTLNSRTQEYYSYAQDQWKVRPNFTLTYGVGWTIDTPVVDNFHNNHATPAFRPGQQSALFPTAPTGYVFQGDVPNAYGGVHYKDFGPRLGFAYSPSWGWLTGGAGNTSIRAGYGIYFDRFEGETALQFNASAPFAQNSGGAADVQGLSPSFANPFVDVAGHGSEPNKFPFGGPTANINFAQFEPLSISVFDPNIRVPYVQNFNFTLERQLGPSTVLSLGYVGAIGHDEVIAYELNPNVNQAGCAATPACVMSSPFENTAFPNNYAFAGNIFGSIGNVATVGNSNYNAFQAELNRHFAHGLQFQAAYTYSRSMDNGSGFENSSFGGGGFGGFGSLRGSNPFNRNLDYGPSIFDATNRLVINYDYVLPSVRRFNSLAFLPSRLTDGWTLNGITTFQTGFPLDVIDSGFRSLACDGFTFYQCPDVPNAVAPVKYFNPRNTSPATGLSGNFLFNPKDFAQEAFGTFGNAGRNLLRGSGINNFDFSLFKDTRLTESTKLEVRFEFFNLFNHTQFNPSGVVTDINASNFGQELSARASRLIQLGAKLYF